MTAQIPERLIIDGKETAMAFCPPLPYGHPRIVEVDEAEAARDAPFVFSTACWRGYVGTWEIKEGRFFLVGLRGKYRMLGTEPLLADWFTGILRIPKGKMLHYVHMGFGSVYEQELHIKIEDGMVVASRVIDNRGKRFNVQELALKNLPGWENRFPGDDEW